MAKISKEQMDALLSQGLISTELYNATVKGDKVDENAIRMAGKDAVALQKQAEQFGGTGRRQQTGTIQLPETVVQSSKPPEQLQKEADEAMGVKPYYGPGSTNPYNPDFALGEDARQRALAADKKQSEKGIGERLSDATVEGVSDVGRRVLPESVGKTLFPKPEDVKKPEPAKPDTTKAPEGSLATDQLNKTGSTGGMGGLAAPPKPHFSNEMQALIDRLETSYGDQKIGLATLRDVIKQQSEESAKIQGQAVTDLEARAAVEAKQQKAEQDYMNAEIERLKAKADELGSRELNPERAWERGLFKGNATANKIVAGIGMLFGAGGTRKGGVNPAVKVIEDAIDRDIDMQKFEKVAGFRGLENQRGILAQYRLVTDDRRVAEQAAKLDYLQRTQLKLEEISTKFKGPKAEGDYQVAAAALDEKIAEQRIALQSALERSAKVGGAGGASMKSIHEDQRYISEALEKAGIPGVEASLANAEDAIKQSSPLGGITRGALGQAEKAGPLVGALAQGAYGMVDEGGLRTEQAIRTLVAQVVKMRSGASATDAERQDLMRQTIGDGSPAALAAGIGALKAEVQTRKNNIMTGAAEPGRLEQARRAGQEEKISPTKKPGQPGAAK